MPDTEASDLEAAWSAAVDQYHAACAEHAKNPTDAMARLNKRQAAERLDVMRTHWRKIGGAVGARPENPKAIGVAIADNDGSI